ncbi:hypothetical protein GUJ93_ZPchr0012g21717 [Zizania palustris]|uniref:Uncharacterized protein n=1 Tax=Zizania palustris TaxID=103762 RepID=A0A8J5WU22_ZIZPA|nr:hypothetical protein GUJ93_ZPchr0012g21717 [Zizania palustris]
MEAGGLVADMNWIFSDLPWHAKESETMARQLLGAFPINGEEGHLELPWFDQPSTPCYYDCNVGSLAAPLGNCP